TVGAALVMPGLTAWQGLFEHGRLQAGQSVLVHGAAGVVGSMATQLAREAGAYVIGTGRASGRQTALDFGAQEFVDLDNDALEDVGGVDLVFDVLGGDVAKRSAGVIRAGGTLVTIAGPTEARPADGRTVDFVVVPDRAQLSEIVRRARDGRVRTNIGNVAALDDAVAAFNPTERTKGKTIIRVRPGATRACRCPRPAGAVQIGRLRPIRPAGGNLGNYPWPLALDVERAPSLQHVQQRERKHSCTSTYPFTHRNSHTVSIVDLGSRERVAELKVPGRTRWTIYDDSRELFFVNIASPARIIVIDARNPTKIAREYDIPAAGPHGLDSRSSQGSVIVRLRCRRQSRFMSTRPSVMGPVMSSLPE